MRTFHLQRLIPLAAAAVAAACAGDSSTNPLRGTGPAASVDAQRVDADRGGAVYTMTNATTGNTIVAFRRSESGELSPLGTFATGGAGSGGTVDPLVSQYSLLLSDDSHLLFAVNAGSNELTTFQVGADGELSRPRVVGSGGVRPTSVAVHRNLLYVLNAGSNSVQGYRVGQSGELAVLPGTNVPLPDGASGAAAIRFSADGKNLIVSERVSNRLDVFAVGENGRLGEAATFASHGRAAFGFDVTAANQVLVSETVANAPNGGITSYALSDGALTVITGSATTGGAAPCWLLNTRDGRFSYVVNSASSTIATFAIGGDGSVSQAGPLTSTGSATTPLDPAFSSGDKYLYFVEGRSGNVSGFAVGGAGGLTPVTVARAGAGSSGLQGLAAF